MTQIVGSYVSASRHMPRTLVVLVLALFLSLASIWLSSSMERVAFSAIDYEVPLTKLWQRFRTTEQSNPLPDCVPIYLVPSRNDSHYTVGEHDHFVVDGIHKSPHLRITTNNTEGNVWIIDMLRSNPIGVSGGCKVYILPELHNASIARKNQYGGKLTSSNSTNWTLIHSDWSDGNYHWKCDGMDAFVGEENIRWTKRSTVASRSVKVIFNHTKGLNTSLEGWRFNATLHDWIIEPGHISITPDKAKHTAYKVRTDHVNTIASVLRRNHGIMDYPNKTWNLADLNRSRDGNGVGVCHFWPLNWHNYDHCKCQLRDAVSFTIDVLRRDKNISAFVGLRGTAGEGARISAEEAYVEHLLRCKIVVVTQRDGHEDHYRLMEALSSGSMVLSDPMLRLPTGFFEGDNIVFFHNKSDLEEKILYYLGNETARVKVAQKGWNEAMARHRSWHYVEELVFGEIRTKGILTPTRSSCY